uniref:Endonuclease V n=1 Tax=Pavo cristatus TaxID=9049 RepID=A0A8C9EZ52_PAVCR
MVAVSAPYVAGFLAFREVPFMVEAVQRLQREQPDLRPQVLLVDGNGLLHQRGFGVACHLGVLTDLPCVGVAKNLLHVDGLVKDELHKEQICSLQKKGDTFPLTGTSGAVLGMVNPPPALRGCNNSSKPLYVSVGHRICLETAVHLVKSCCKYRIPEPIRQASSQWRERDSCGCQACVSVPVCHPSASDGSAVGTFLAGLFSSACCVAVCVVDSSIFLASCFDAVLRNTRSLHCRPSLTDVLVPLCRRLQRC